MSRTLNVAAVQLDGRPAPRRERLARAERLIAEAAEGAQLVVLPEVFNTGYEYSDANYTRAESVSGPTVRWMTRVAARYGVHLAGTLLLLDLEDIYNALLLVAPDGRTWRYDKRYPWVWERAYFRPGERLTVAETELGAFGLLICWDQAHPALWARYAGHVDALLVCSAPPMAHAPTFVFPDGTRLRAEDAGPLPRQMKQASGGAFGRCLRAQGAALGVPVIQTTATGTFSSEIPRPRLSLLLYAFTRVDLWGKFLRSPDVRVEMPFYQETWVANAEGEVLARVPAGVEGYARREVALPDCPPFSPGTQPPYGISPFAYLFDRLGNALLTPRYRRQVRKTHGPRMAPVDRRTRGWRLALLVVAGLAFLLGRLLERRKRRG